MLELPGWVARRRTTPLLGFCVIYPDAESGDWYLAKCDTWKRDVGR
jgi:hypothetical protein